MAEGARDAGRGILCQGRRTVSRVLQVMGFGQEPHYGNDYRMLSRVGWSGLAGGQTLLALIIVWLVGNQTVVIGIDETLERRWGKRIWGLGIYRDEVKSSSKPQRSWGKGSGAR